MKGFSLIEVLIVLFLFSCLIINYAQHKFRIKISLQQSYYKHLALQQILSLQERLKVNEDVSHRLHEINEWQQENGHILPQGRGAVHWQFGKPAIATCWKYGSYQCVTFPASDNKS
ncbi:MAG: prepilin-type N-terminal cleavage/methylation domain-containing protein [Gammaproteobacteria bacterium]|nr:prepilin-type N-terminal cleavage/methylation domain-containing protein [Gammaproteobacteria bacterium]